MAQKKVLSRWSWFWMIVVFLILLYIVLEKFGIHLVYRTEKEELIEHPHWD